jgi:hypothetical protein
MNEMKITKGASPALGLGRRSKSRGEHAGRRSKGRDSLFLMATVRKASEPDADAIPARIRNLSEVGVMADYMDVAEPGDAVTVEVRGLGTVPGMVAWVKSGRIGITFDTEVDPLLARKPVGGQTAPEQS